MQLQRLVRFFTLKIFNFRKQNNICYAEIQHNHFILHFPLSHLRYIKHFIEDFLHEQLLHSPFEHEHVAITSFILSVTASSCHRGINEMSGSHFQPHSIGSGIFISISLSFHRQPAWMQARFICCKIPDGDETSIRRFMLGVEMR